MFKNFVKGLVALCVLVMSFGVTLHYVAPVEAGALEDRLAGTYFTILFQNYRTAGLPSTNSRGQTAYDIDRGTLSYNNGAGWVGLMGQTTHVQVTQGTAPTVASCGSGAVRTLSTDSAGAITNVGTSCILTFNSAFVNRPIVLASVETAQGNVPKAIGLVTGIEFYGMTAASTIDYAVIGIF